MGALMGGPVGPLSPALCDAQPCSSGIVHFLGNNSSQSQPCILGASVGSSRHRLLFVDYLKIAATTPNRPNPVKKFRYLFCTKCPPFLDVINSENCCKVILFGITSKNYCNVTVM